MAESVPVRCPSCRREHRFTAPSYPCVCGAPVAPLLDPDGTVTPVSHRVWRDDWVTVRCASCGRHGEWPRPEVGCPCGAVLRVPVTEGRAAADRGGSTGQDMATGGRHSTDRDIRLDAGAEAGRETGRRDAAAAGERAFASGALEGTTASPEAEQTPASAGAGLPPVPSQAEAGAPVPSDAEAGANAPSDAEAGADAPDSAGAARPPFRSVTIRTALDAVTAAALYLRWLGYRGVRRADQRPPSGIGLAARGVVALVDPAVRPATLRDVECLWLTAMTESADCLCFSLAGYAADARARADALGVPLFVLDLTGTPRPVNAPAGALDATGTENRAP
ncbi:hypothetical protein [Streptomyces africanus]|uniref:hypothetical protein n=1 Tax=Streptomyces africanus TaxID=231024 RepID=UPI000A37FAE0|nr:hypothetical protein [Streptomyces africanus]